jgi:hypothetical protein
MLEPRPSQSVVYRAVILEEIGSELRRSMRRVTARHVALKPRGRDPRRGVTWILLAQRETNRLARLGPLLGPGATRTHSSRESAYQQTALCVSTVRTSVLFPTVRTTFPRSTS